MAHDTPAPGDGQGSAPGEISVLRSPTRTTLMFTGEIDVGLNAQLVEAVEEALGRGLPVDVDVRAVTFMDSAAMAMIARLAYQATTPPRIIEPPENVRFLLGITNIEEVVTVVSAGEAGGDAGSDAERAPVGMTYREGRP